MSDVGSISYNELYKLHTGHNIYDSESDSSDSMASSSFLDKNKPPLYTYEELKANSVVVGLKNEHSNTGLNWSAPDVASEALDSDSLQQEMIKKELETLVSLDSCILCNINGRSHHDIDNHKTGKAHQKKVDQYIRDRLQKLQSKKIVVQTYGNDPVQTGLYIGNKNTPNTSAANSFLNPANVNTQGIIQEQLENLVCSNYCYICEADLPQLAQVDSHYNSNRHKNNLNMWICTTAERLQPSGNGNLLSEVVVQRQQSNINDAGTWQTTASSNKNVGSINDFKPVIPNVYCMICGINVGAGLQDHYRSDSHKRCSEFIFVRNTNTMSKGYLAKYEGISHKNNLEVKERSNNSLTVPQTIVTPIIKKEEESLSELCNSGNKKHRSVNNNDDTSKPISENGDSRKVVNCDVNIFYCYSCKVKCSSQLQLTTHAKNFPHSYVAHLKSLAVSLGVVTQEFWRHDNLYIWCTLCKVTLQSESSAKDHFQSRKHIDQFNIWCRAQIKDMKDPNRKWYFCDICKISLDGTTNVELHYQGLAHTKRQDLMNTSQVTNASTSTDVLKTEPRSDKTLNNFKQQQEETIKNCENLEEKNEAFITEEGNNSISVSNGNEKYRGNAEKLKRKNEDLNTTDTANISTTQYSSQTNTDKRKNFNKLTSTERNTLEEDAKFLQEVQSEVEKFTCSVKSIPPNIALKFLRKYTEELENFKKNSEAKTANMEHINKISGNEKFLNNDVGKNDNYITENNQYVSADNQSLNNMPKPNTSNYSIPDLLYWGVAAIMFYSWFKKK